MKARLEKILQNSSIEHPRYGKVASVQVSFVNGMTISGGLRKLDGDEFAVQSIMASPDGKQTLVDVFFDAPSAIIVCEPIESSGIELFDKLPRS